MIKLIYCLNRKSDLTREEFLSYWRNTHAEIVKKYQPDLKIVRYIQLHTIANDEKNNSVKSTTDKLRQFRGCGEPYDGVAELWYNNEEDILNGSKEASMALLNDEKKFVDHSRSSIWISIEHRIID